jgi:predicted small integral membrane protein
VSGAANWMGWTLPTALFFIAIALILTAMGVLQKLAPRNEPRVGVLGIATQRGDRLFLSLLGSAFIHLAWIGLAPASLPLWLATLASLVYAALVFRFA